MSDNGHILIVDDAQEICDVVQEYLTGEGFRVSTAHDGAGMRDALSRSPADLVILDLMLPGEDGLTLARSLRSRSAIGIIILTGRGETVDRIIGLEMGADDYLPKPFNLRELLARVKSVLRRVQSRTGDDPQPDPVARPVRRLGLRFIEPRIALAGGTRRSGSRPGSSICSRLSSPMQTKCCRATGCSIWRATARRVHSTARSMCRSDGCGASSRTTRKTPV